MFNLFKLGEAVEKPSDKSESTPLIPSYEQIKINFFIETVLSEVKSNNFMGQFIEKSVKIDIYEVNIAYQTSISNGLVDFFISVTFRGAKFECSSSNVSENVFEKYLRTPSNWTKS